MSTGHEKINLFEMAKKHVAYSSQISECGPWSDGDLREYEKRVDCPFSGPKAVTPRCKGMVMNRYLRLAVGSVFHRSVAASPFGSQQEMPCL